MADDLKSGKQIIDEFFSGLVGRTDLDKGLVDALRKLHAEGKLSNTHVSNALLALREEAMHESAGGN